MSEISLDDTEFQAIFHDYWQNRGMADVDSDGQTLIEKVKAEGSSALATDAKLARTFELRKERKHDAFKVFRNKITEEARILETNESAWIAFQALNFFDNNRTERLTNRPKISKLLDSATDGNDAIASQSVQTVCAM